MSKELPNATPNRQVETMKSGHVDVSTIQDVDTVYKSHRVGALRNVWNKADGIAVAKACTAFLIGVLIFAVLLSIDLTEFTTAWFG